MSSQPIPRGLQSLSEIANSSRDAFERRCRFLASPLYLGEDVALCRILGRNKLYVSTRDDGFGANVLLDGYWETWLTQFMARTVRPGMTTVDVGANYGYYTLLMADLVGPSGAVYAVEPNPDVATLLRRSVLLNGFYHRTTICEVGAGAGPGSATLLVPEGEPKNGALIAGEWAGAGAQYEVAVAALDDLIPADRAIDFIKIDAEGGEEAIIAGMSRIFETQRPAMVLEFNAARYADPAGFLDRLVQLYGALAHVDYAGQAEAVTPNRVLGERFGEDWLLFLSMP